MKKGLTFLLIIIHFSMLYSQEANQLSGHRIEHQMNEYELSRADEIGLNYRSTPPPSSPIINIAEYQPMQGVLIRYPFGIPIDLISQLSQLVTVTTIVENQNQRNSVNNQYMNNNVNMSNVDYLIAPTNSYWTRDYGPWFIIDGNDEFGVVDFIYNRPREDDNAIIQAISNHLDVNYFAMDLLHTGGNYMCDGYGTAASTTLIVEENSNESVSSIQATMESYLGIDNYHLFSDPLGDYIDHIDCWGKFLQVDKVLIGQVPSYDSRYSDFEAIADWFSNATTPWGNHYTVYRVFTPGTMNVVTPYTNSLILNNHVFVPVTGCEWDDEAIAVYETAMPGYTIVPINERYDAPWENTDALHCRTHEIADLNMLLISHFPTLGDQPYQSEFAIRADIKAYSGQPLVSDSLLIFYRINEGLWETANMVNVGGNSYEGLIPIPDNGCEIDYYIFAKDQSNKREKHPYIGAYDPHHFSVSPQGIASFDKHPIAIYPNPADQYFTINTEKIDQIVIFNSIGQIIHTITQQSYPFVVNCSNWQNGIYHLRFLTEEGKIIHKKISITHSR